MLQKIDNWLRDPKRDYAFGLSVFNQLASADMKTKYGTFLNDGNPKDKESMASRFPMLINKVTAIYNMVKANPDAFKDALGDSSTDLVKKITDLDKEGKAMQAKIEELEELDEDKTAEIEQLQEELDEKNEEIENLAKQLEEKGVKVFISGNQLPEALREKYERTREIIPLMAAIHAELKDTAITDEERKAKAEELCKLDDERRKIWDEIDKYLEGKNIAVATDKSLEYSEEPITRGMQIANRIARLKENIKRASDSIKKYEAADNKNGIARATKRHEAYIQELKQLQAQVDDNK